MEIAKADYIEGMAKGLAVLESFDTERQRLNATMAAQRAGLTRAAARRHLLTLAHLGYLDTDGSHYWLSPKVLRLSGSYLASARLPRAVQPTLNRLAAQAHGSFSVVVLDGAEVVIVARSVSLQEPDEQASSLGTPWRASASPRVLAYGLHLGARLPAHATSTGRMLLSALDRSAFAAWMKTHPLYRITPFTQTDAGQFRRQIAQARAQDHCLASEEHELGVHALAVPLRNQQGHTVAALNVVSTRQRLSPDAVAQYWLPLLHDAARELRPVI